MHIIGEIMLQEKNKEIRSDVLGQLKEFKRQQQLKKAAEAKALETPSQPPAKKSNAIAELQKEINVPKPTKVTTQSSINNVPSTCTTLAEEPKEEIVQIFFYSYLLPLLVLINCLIKIIKLHHIDYKIRIKKLLFQRIGNTGR